MDYRVGQKISDGNKSIAYVILLILLCGVLYFPYLGSTPFSSKGEPREAIAVQDIVQRGEWLVPLKRAMDIPSKPPLFHWSAALTAALTGKLDEATIRFPSALYATLGVLIVYLFGQKLFERDVAFLAAAILATTWVYADQALNARVDMTLCFVVTVNLVLFYSLYRGFLTHPLWFYVFYVLLGIGVLAKGPLGIVLPGLIIGTFVVAKKRWDLIRKFCLHPGVLLTLLLGVGWYIAAVTREGEGFFHRQILQENLSRFVGGSGHSHPPYYYLSYLFILAMPWGLFLPFVLWDAFKQRSRFTDELLFLKLWFVTMFVFFSISIGKRAVYLLPLYPALSMLTAVWFYNQGTTSDGKSLRNRCFAIVAGITGLLLLMITLGAAWNCDASWLFGPIETFLKPKDHTDLIAIRNQLEALGWSFLVGLLLSSALWFWLAKDLWVSRMYHAAFLLVLVSIALTFVNRAIVMPVIAEARSYRPFMEEVNQRVKPGDKLYLYGEVYDSDPVIFYRGGGLIEKVEQPAEKIASRIGHGNEYLILAERDWITIQQFDHSIPPPLLKSTGAGPDAPIVLVRFEGCNGVFL
jgi:Dolichyl-phosphate-mannose-protein mannosyltransferase